jgi:tRNA(adenine34) deaminase
MKTNPTSLDLEMIEKVLTEAETAIEQGGAGVASLLLWRDEILACDHNLYEETKDVTAHAEMTVLRKSAKRIDAMSEEEKQDLTIYTSLEPCLMCFSAISFAGIKRIVYSALNADATEDAWIADDITIDFINQRLVKGKIELVPGVLRERGKKILAQMGKKA